MNDYRLPFEYQYRRPDGTVLIRFQVSPSTSFMSLSPEQELWLTREPVLFVERRVVGQEDWTVFGELRNGPDGRAWVSPPA